MNMANDATRRFWRRMGVNFVGGAVVGALFAVVAFQWIEQLDFGDAHVLGLIIGGLLGYLGLSMLWSAANPKRAARLMQTTLEPGEDFSAETRSLRLQAVVALLAAVELLMLSWRTDVLTGPAQPLLLGTLLALLLAQTWLNVRLWRSGDEFFRRLLLESGVAAFVVVQFLVFAWAVGGRFGYVDEPTALDIYVLLMAVYLLAGIWAGSRRGLGMPDS